MNKYNKVNKQQDTSERKVPAHPEPSPSPILPQIHKTRGKQNFLSILNILSSSLSTMGRKKCKTRIKSTYFTCIEHLILVVYCM